MTKPELGTKRVCAGCNARFYDLMKDPIVCPKCNTVMTLAPVPVSRSRGEPAAARAAAPVAREVEVAAPETADAEFVSLEDADAEAQGKKSTVEAGEGADDEIEIDPALDDAALIEEQEETDEDVTDIIGDREDEEEA